MTEFKLEEPLNTFTYELTPPEYRTLVNLLVRVGKKAAHDMNSSWADRKDTENYKACALILDRLGIDESEIAEVKEDEG